MMTLRKVVKFVRSREQPEGMGAIVRRSIGRPELRNFDPFLMLDDGLVAPPAGFPDHPHRGFETVTYIIEGSVEHEDFAGHHGLIKVGDLQWMTAGKGIVHAEMPATEDQSRVLQLWVNLASKYKMIEPAYQELTDDKIPKITVDDGKVRIKIIAGESHGVKSPVLTRTPTIYIDFEMQPNAKVEQIVPSEYNVFIYVLDGEALFSGEDGKETLIGEYHTIVFGAGDSISVKTGPDSSARFVLIAGIPLNEPVVQHGPFVMNTHEEIEETLNDYYNYRNGFERAREWSSTIGNRSWSR